MSQLIPTAVTLENLIDETAAINVIDLTATALVSPRRHPGDTVIVQVKDDPRAPTLESGTADANVLNSLSASAADFVTAGVAVGDAAVNTDTGLSALVTEVTSATVLVLDADVFPAGTEAFKVIPASYWVQKATGGEWRRSGARTGGDKSVAYTLPVNTASTVVHDVVYPIALADIATYPPIG